MQAERIAIVGVGGVFPGARDLAAFWRHVAEAIDAGRPAPEQRWFLKPGRVLAPGGPQADRVYSTWCCPLDDVALEFDPSGLNVDRALLDRLDPLFRIGLKAAQSAWGDARRPKVEPQRAGVILGHIVLPTESTSALARDVLVRDFAKRLLSPRAVEWPKSTWDRRNWLAAGLPAALIAQALGLAGVAFTLDAACASSLYALKLACDELRSGRADVMLAGGLSRPDSQYTQMGFAQLQALTKRGRCAPLSAAADGLVVGEGAGLFVLKRLTDAQRNHDRIYAIIAGIGLSNDRGANLLAPHSEGQLRAMREAYRQAQWRPGDVDLIECHATGTPIGDGVELDSLHTLWREERGLPRRCVLGSVKSNVGHLLTGAGGASLMKMLWALQETTLPPTANFVDPAPGLVRPDSPFRVLSQAEPWPSRGNQIPRRAAINAFGFGGINAHVLLEEWNPETATIGNRLQPLLSSKMDSTAPKTPHTSEAIAIVGLGARCGSMTNLSAVQARFFGDRPTAHEFTIAEVVTPVGTFRIPPLELEEMLPQQQLMLHVAAAALDDAGVERTLGDRTGVFVGINLDPNTTNFHGRWSLEAFAPQWAESLDLSLSNEDLADWVQQLRDAFGPPLTANRVMGNLGGIVASRLAREFDVGGPSFTVSSDETSGLQALEIAVRALQQNDLDQAIVGAVDLQSDVRLSAAPVLHPPGDAAVAFVLKRLTDAERDGDRVYAVISAVTATNNLPQLEPIPPPRAGNHRDLSIGDVASDVGFCGAAAGLLACLKGTLAVHQQRLPPKSPVESHGAEFWLRNRQDGPRRALVDVTGQAGARVCVRLEEFSLTTISQPPEWPPLGSLPVALFVFDGDALTELTAAIHDCRALIVEDRSLSNAARRWFQRRPPLPSRGLAAVIVAATAEEWNVAADEVLQALQDSNAAPVTFAGKRALFTATPLGRDGRVAFVFPGSGNQFLGMGREILATWPDVLRRQDAENDRLRDQFQPDLLWNGPSTEAIGQQHKAMIFGQVALGAALCDWLALFGVRPQAAIGYSLGESAALFGLRAWNDRDEMLRRIEASPLFGSDLVHPFDAARRVWNIPIDEDVPWVSGVIDRSADAVRGQLGQFRDAYLLIVNTAAQCVIGGRRTEVERLVAELGATYIPLPAASTVHCEVLQSVAADYLELHRLPTTIPQAIAFYSSASGQSYRMNEEAAAAAILAQALNTVDFPRTIEQAYADGVRLFIEIGPGSSCTRMIDEILGERPHGARALCPATAEPVAHALRVLAELIVHRVPVDLTPLFRDATTAIDVAASPSRGVVTATSLPPFRPPRPMGNRPVAAATVFDPSPNRAASATLAPAPLSMPERPLVKQTARAMTTDPAPAWPPVERRSAIVVQHAEAAKPASAPLALASTVSNVSEPADAVVQFLERWHTERAAAHAAFLQFSRHAQLLVAQCDAADGLAGVEEDVSAIDDEGQTSAGAPSPPHPRTLAPLPTVIAPPLAPPRSLNYLQCLQFAIGKIGDVLGPQFAEIDSFPTRVRLPDAPLQLVDRILAIEGEPLSMSTGRVVTEHDIHADDWYLDCGVIPTCLAVESGQADLFLSGWLGIDLQTRGLASYRLLDAVVTFHDALPGPGNTIHYDIRINHFFRQGETYLFRFEFDATVNGKPLLTMRDGCAGFFTMAELAAGQGIIHTALDKQPRPGVRPDDWTDPAPMTHAAYSDEQLLALRRGDLAACFGPAFAGLPLKQPVTLPSGRLNLVHRVLELEPGGGKYGLGRIKAEADIHPDDWFLTCHFCDDQVMPGTLMYECCLHTLRIYLLRMGWIGEAGQIVYEPVPHVKSRLKCRGQVLSTTKKVWYEVTLKEVGYGKAESGKHGAESHSKNSGLPLSALSFPPSHAYCVADALMYADGKPIVEITDMSVRLTGLTRDAVERLWSGEECEGTGVRERGNKNANVVGAASFTPAPPHPRPPAHPIQAPLFDTDRITAFAIGNPSDAFGDRYRVFDRERKIARLPGPPFQFLDRIVSIRDGEPWKLAAGCVIEAEYDVPMEAWYFSANRQPTMPFAVLLETALQPCGWLAAYLGSALSSDVDLSFRNLGGKATQFEDVTSKSGTLTTTVKITRVSQSAGMIIQHYDFDLRCNGRPVYVGDTYFGFFSAAALANQVGIRDADVYRPTDAERQRGRSFPVPTESPFPDERFRMVTNVDLFVPDGGPHRLGIVRGSVHVDPSMWFFKAHFFQDPVWPGSLGLESFLQLLKVYAADRWGYGMTEVRGSESEKTADNVLFSSTSPSPHAPTPASNFSAVALHHSHEWVYRGQVIPRDKTVTVDVLVTAVDDARRIAKANGFLTVDGRVIYQMKDFTVAMNPGVSLRPAGSLSPCP